MRIFRGAAAALFLIAAPARAAGEESADFVVKGTTLDLRWAGATIQAPASQWRWSRTAGLDTKKLDGFECVNTMNEHEMAFFFLVTRERIKPLSAGEMDDFVREIRKSMGKDIWVMARPEYAPSDIPWPGSYRFRYELTSSRATAYLYGYAGRKTRGYMTECITLEPVEPPACEQISRSLFVRETGKNPKSRILMGLVVVVAVIGVVQWLRSR